MISENTLNVRGKVREDLDAAMDRFLAAGGSITEAPAPSFTPRPVSAACKQFIAPPPAVRRRRLEQQKQREQAEKLLRAGERQEIRNTRDAQLEEMAKTMTMPEVRQAMGITKNTLLSIAKRRGFQFVPTHTGNMPSPERDAADIERVIELKAQGLTRRRVAMKMEISWKKLDRLITLGGIDFPKVVGALPRK